MITQTEWEESLGQQVKFFTDTASQYTVMVIFDEGTYAVYDKLCPEDDQPLYHNSSLFKDESIALDYAIEALTS